MALNIYHQNNIETTEVRVESQSKSKKKKNFICPYHLIPILVTYSTFTYFYHHR